MNMMVTFFVPDTFPVDSGCVTYESVLLTYPSRSKSPPVCPYTHKTTSYAQIDAMLDKMLWEVERQEKLFNLDLDLLEIDSDDACVNTLELHPSTDAMIEIPIKKSIKVPKIYETSHAIVVDDKKDTNDYYEVMSFTNSKPAPNNDQDYDLIQFDEDTKSSLDEIHVTNINFEAEEDEVELLLDDEKQDFNIGNKSSIVFQNMHTASSESLSDASLNDDWNDDDYEPIDSSTIFSNYPYELYQNNDIWWEGTYRNLSVVPEEDEENASLLGTYSNKSFSNKLQFPECSNRSSFLSTSTKDTDLDSDAESTSNKSFVKEEKIIKAEVKLLVKTSEHGKEAIEIRSVREFMENPNKAKAHQTKLGRSLTLPSRFDKRQSTFKSCTKSGSDSCLIGSENEYRKNKKPVFTLPNLFIRIPDAKGNSTKQYNNSTKSRTELFPAPINNYPLQHGVAGYEPFLNNTHSKQHNVDLFANAPFYPCYDFIPNKKLNISYPSDVPKAYCDWIPQYGVSLRGNVELFPC